MLHSNHVHKSMLLRGVKFPKPALNEGDKEATRGRATRGGRSHGGAPLRGGYNQGGRGRDSFNYAPQGDSYSRPPQQRPYGGQNGYNGSQQYQSQSQGWQPPPPGLAGFASGPPPPPPGYGGHPQQFPGQRQQSGPPGTYGNQYNPSPSFDRGGGYDNRGNGGYNRR